MKKKKRFLLFVVLAFVLSACGTREKDAPKEKEQVGNTQEENIQEEGKQKENDSKIKPKQSKNENEDTQKPDSGIPELELSSKPLEFFDASFHDEEGFTFDGFSLLDEYEGWKRGNRLTDYMVISIRFPSLS